MEGWDLQLTNRWTGDSSRTRKKPKTLIKARPAAGLGKGLCVRRHSYDTHRDSGAGCVGAIARRRE